MNYNGEEVYKWVDGYNDLNKDIINGWVEIMLRIQVNEWLYCYKKDIMGGWVIGRE